MICAACGDDDGGAVDAPLVVRDAAVADAAAIDGAAIDATAIDATLAQQCVDLRAKWNALVEPLARTCDTPADCAVVGERSVRSCEQYPQLPGRGPGELEGDCNGAPVNAAALAPKLDEVRALEQTFAQLCGNDRSLCSQEGISCVVDCAPGATITCIDHTCGMTFTNGCPPFPPDARP